MSTVGKNIRSFRDDKQITQEALAEHLSVTRQAVSNWECGRTEPDIDTLHKIALFLEVTVEELIYGEKRQYINNITNISEQSKKVTKAGIGFGTGLAMVISYAAWESIGWAIVHGILGWIYVIYYMMKY